MKEILFRGKTETGRWVYGSLILAGSYCCILEEEDKVHPMDYPYLDPDLGTIDGKLTPVIPETVGRLIDCPDYDKFADEKIFEGDIVEVYERHYRTIDPFTPTMPLSRAIIVDEHTITVDGRHYWRTQDTKTVKIIGNIYDNPELLDKKYIDYFKSFYCLKN